MSEFIPDREELAWAAGFFDGEGTTYCRKDPKGRYTSVAVSVAQNGTEALERFQRAVGSIGSIAPRYPGEPEKFHDWRVSSFERSQAVIAMLWPFLCTPKREQAKAAFLHVREAPNFYGQYRQPRKSKYDREL